MTLRSSRPTASAVAAELASALAEILAESGDLPRELGYLQSV